MLRRASVRPDAWSSMAAWTRSSVVAPRWVSRLSLASLAPCCPARGNVPVPSVPPRGRGSSGRMRWRWSRFRRPGRQLRSSPNSSLARSVTRPEADDAFLSPDDAGLPVLHVDAQGLGEAPSDVEWQSETRHPCLGGFVLFLCPWWQPHFRRYSGGSRGTGRSVVRPLPERPAAPLRAWASAVPSTCWRASRPTTSQTLSRYSGRVTSLPSGVSTRRYRL